MSGVSNSIPSNEVPHNFNIHQPKTSSSPLSHNETRVNLTAQAAIPKEMQLGSPDEHLRQMSTTKVSNHEFETCIQRSHNTSLNALGFAPEHSEAPYENNRITLVKDSQFVSDEDDIPDDIPQSQPQVEEPENLKIQSDEDDIPDEIPLSQPQIAEQAVLENIQVRSDEDDIPDEIPQSQPGAVEEQAILEKDLVRRDEAGIPPDKIPPSGPQVEGNPDYLDLQITKFLKNTNLTHIKANSISKNEIIEKNKNHVHLKLLKSGELEMLQPHEAHNANIHIDPVKGDVHYPEGLDPNVVYNALVKHGHKVGIDHTKIKRFIAYDAESWKNIHDDMAAKVAEKYAVKTDDKKGKKEEVSSSSRARAQTVSSAKTAPVFISKLGMRALENMISEQLKDVEARRRENEEKKFEESKRIESEVQKKEIRKEENKAEDLQMSNLKEGLKNWSKEVLAIMKEVEVEHIDENLTYEEFKTECLERIQGRAPFPLRDVNFPDRLRGAMKVETLEKEFVDSLFKFLSEHSKDIK